MASGIGNLTTLIKRLEAATSRLEDIAMSQSAAAQDAGLDLTPPTQAAPSTTAVASSSSDTALNDTASKGESESKSLPTVSAWDEDVEPAVKEYVAASEALSPLVAEHAKLVQATMQQLRSVVVMAAMCYKPKEGLASTEYTMRLEPLQQALHKVVALREEHRGDRDWFNHLSTVNEGITAVGWVAVEPTPAPYIGDMMESAQFYANRVIKEFKERDPKHVQWARAFMNVLSTMQLYVKAHHRTGITWNPQGAVLNTYYVPEDAPMPVMAQATSSVASEPAPPTAPPAPPAPPAVAPPAAPPAPAMAGAAVGATAAPSMDAVFSQINQGEGITSSLRKVDASEMTHKNPSLRASGTVPDAEKARPAPAAKPVSLSAKKRGAPRKVLEGNKWTIENFDNDAHVVIDNTELGQTVHIFHCDRCVIEVKGKINAVSMLSCSKTNLLLDTLVSSLEVTRCTSFAAQITGTTPTILIDSCDGGHVYLSEQGMHADLITAKSSALNVSVPAANGEPGELDEIPLPEQVKHTIARSGSRTVANSEVVQHAG
ncbi:adenylyl-cyclase-associated protein cap [Malassezia pachydermatis]|uniref:Adenylyl cyclase-associated protein n=1 Tax=Malassezia pachydermatis TaxID=77020 RepID=A0A0N0RRU7_9BASI|nr:adenylyl-cyclase-associated protein cap [Malassezia pachydermatis]KOS12522.1 adenylyl-cyclase-associated protein cap [Malassezia pachydermatis]